MTTPVLQESKGRSWKIAFILPNAIKIQNAPVPLDTNIEIKEIPGRTLASFRNNGNNNADAMQNAETKLMDWAKSKNLQIIGAVHWAQYDQPFAVPFLKRNEAQIEVKV